MKSPKDMAGKGAVEIIEEAVHLLRRAPLSALTSYYVGTLPFVLGLLYFWGDMSRNAFAENYCAPASLGLAVLFFWMKFWQAVFGGQVKALANGETASVRLDRNSGRRVITQAAIHASGLVVLPCALVLVVPFAWVYAFYQNVTVQEDCGQQSIREVCALAWRQALLWPGQNHLLLSTFSLFGLFVFINVTSALLFLPQLLKMLLGVETVFTMSGFSALNTTFLAAACSLTYVCLDPLMKTVYALRCFYGVSLRTGDDLKALMKPTFVAAAMKSLIALLIIGGGFLVVVNGHASSQAEAGGQEDEILVVSPEALDRSIERVMDRREFAWRLPRDKPGEDKKELPGPIAALFNWIGRGIKTSIEVVKGWIENLLKWLIKMFPRDEQHQKSSETEWLSSIRILLAGLLVVLGCILGYLFWRTWMSRRERPAAVVTEPVMSVPDLADEGTQADELPTDRWLALARELMEEGSLRLAMRALYLATLAMLADHNRISIAKHKSNRDYERELQRHAHDEVELRTAFSHTIRLIERVWYGMHEVTRDMVDRYSKDQQRIMALVEQ